MALTTVLFLPVSLYVAIFISILNLRCLCSIEKSQKNFLWFRDAVINRTLQNIAIVRLSARLLRGFDHLKQRSALQNVSPYNFSQLGYE